MYDPESVKPGVTLREARSRARLSQGKLSKLSGVSIDTISNHERNYSVILLITGRALLGAINSKLESMEQPQINFSEMNWRIKGED